MAVERLSFKEAVDALCERYGIPKIYEGALGKSSKEDKTRQEVLKALDLAKSFFQDAFWLREDPIAEEARSYIFQRRRLDRQIAKTYGLGLAPQTATALLTHLVTKKGLDPRVLERAGLVMTSYRDGKYGDFFRNRLVFPVLDLGNRVVAFGGRVLERESVAPGPKYLNSPDTDLFKKGEILYGLAQHKDSIKQKNKCFIVEGYFDVVGLAQVGLNYAVSPMGGALTASQARLLKRFVDTVTIVFDPDQAGMTSAVRAARILITQGIRVQALKLPSKLDPDEFVFKYGKNTFEAFEAKEARGFIDFELEAKLGTQKASSLDLPSRIALAQSLMPTLHAIVNEVERQESLIHVAQALRLDPMGLERELHRDQPRAYPKKLSDSPKELSELSAEETLLALALEDGARVREGIARSSLELLDFKNHKIGLFFFNASFEGDDAWQELISRVTLLFEGSRATRDFSRELEEALEAIAKEKLNQEFRSLKAAIEARRSRGEVCEEELQRFAQVSKLIKKKKISLA